MDSDRPDLNASLAPTPSSPARRRTWLGAGVLSILVSAGWVAAFLVLASRRMPASGPVTAAWLYGVLLGLALLSLVGGLFCLAVGMFPRPVTFRMQGPTLGWVAGIGYLLPLLAAALPGVISSLLAGSFNGSSLPATLQNTLGQLPRIYLQAWPLFTLVSCVTLILLVYLNLLRPGRLSATFASLRTPSTWLLAASLLAGMGLWLAARFLQRLLMAAWPALAAWSGPVLEISPAGLAALLLAGGIALPVAEEMLFRAYLLPRWTARWSAWPAVLASAAVFAALQFNPLQFLPLFLLGIFLAGLVRWRGELLPAIVAHSIYSLLSIAWLVQTVRPA